MARVIDHEDCWAVGLWCCGVVVLGIGGRIGGAIDGCGYMGIVKEELCNDCGRYEMDSG